MPPKVSANSPAKKPTREPFAAVKNLQNVFNSISTTKDFENLVLELDQDFDNYRKSSSSGKPKRP
jgi:hypothetical protein